jgi:hypothetical protein
MLNPEYHSTSGMVTSEATRRAGRQQCAVHQGATATLAPEAKGTVKLVSIFMTHVRKVQRLNR